MVVGQTRASQETGTSSSLGLYSLSSMGNYLSKAGTQYLDLLLELPSGPLNYITASCLIYCCYSIDH